MQIKVAIIEFCFLILFGINTNAGQINRCLSAASTSVANWSGQHEGSEMGTMKFLKCLHYCLVHGKSTNSMSEQLSKCFQTQTLMMNLWNEFLSRDEPIRCFKRVPGKVLIGLVDQLYGNVESPEECERKCRQHTKCNSAAFYQKEKECIVTSETKNTAKELYVDDSNSVYIENLCTNDKLTSGPNESTNNIEQTTETPRNEESTTSEAPEMTQATAIPAEMIDTYGMGTKQKDPALHFQFKDQVLNKNECFSEFYPPNIKTSKVERVESLKDCVSKCRECRKCLDGRRCSIAGYSVERQLCALAPKQQLKELERSRSMGNFIFMRRRLCKD